MKFNKDIKYVVCRNYSHETDLYTVISKHKTKEGAINKYNSLDRDFTDIKIFEADYVAKKSDKHGDFYVKYADELLFVNELGNLEKNIENY